MNKKIILLSLSVIIGVAAFSQLVYAASSTVSVLPATASKNVGTGFNIAVQLDPQGEQVCAVRGTLNFSNLSCQAITVANGLYATVTPTCASPSFILGIPKCTTATQNLLSVSVKGIKAGSATVSFAAVKVIGAGADVAFASPGATYNITAVRTTTPPITTFNHSYFM